MINTQKRKVEGKKASYRWYHGKWFLLVFISLVNTPVFAHADHHEPHQCSVSDGVAQAQSGPVQNAKSMTGRAAEPLRLC